MKYFAFVVKFRLNKMANVEMFDLKFDETENGNNLHDGLAETFTTSKAKRVNNSVILWIRWYEVHKASAKKRY